MKGAHVTIIARSSDDVEESVVLEKVKKLLVRHFSVLAIILIFENPKKSS